MTFLNPLDALIPKIPFSFFADFLGPSHLRGLGVSLGGILGVLSIEPFLGEGEGLARGLYRPPPSSIASPVAPACLVGFAFGSVRCALKASVCAQIIP